MSDKVIYYYEAFVDGRAFYWYGGDDRSARRKMARWFSAKWQSFKVARNSERGLRADDATYYRRLFAEPCFQIGRKMLIGKYVVPACNFTIIENFPLSEVSVAEFVRAYRHKP